MDCLQKIRNKISSSTFSSDEEVREIIAREIIDDDEDIDLDQLDYLVDKYFYKVRRKLGLLDELLKDQEINEIMVNGKDNIFIERKGNIIKLPGGFDTTEELEEIIRYIAGQVHREINEMNPIVDARLADGSRINGVYKNVALNGPILTIRKFQKDYITMDKLIGNGTISPECASMLKDLVIKGYNIFISGGTSSGKTTFLNALADFIPKTERVVVIEDSAELQLNSIDNIVRMECRNANAMGQGQIAMDQLIKASLRMRPDRIIVGEVRGKEVCEMLQALNTGHSGSCSTGHGNSIKGMLNRLEAMYLMGAQLPTQSIASQIISGIDIFVHLGRMASGKRKVIEVAEVIGYREGTYELNSLFKLDTGGILVPTGNDIYNKEKMMMN